MRGVLVPWRRAVLTPLLAVLGGGLLLTPIGGSAQAASTIPNEVISSNPQPNSTLTVVPTQLQLIFRNKLDADDAAALDVAIRNAPFVARDVRSLQSAIYAQTRTRVSYELASFFYGHWGQDLQSALREVYDKDMTYILVGASLPTHIAAVRLLALVHIRYMSDRVRKRTPYSACIETRDSLQVSSGPHHSLRPLCAGQSANGPPEHARQLGQRRWRPLQLGPPDQGTPRD